MKISIDYNKKQEMINAGMNAKYYTDLNIILPLLDIKTITLFGDDYKEYKRLIYITEKEVIYSISTYKYNKNIYSWILAKCDTNFEIDYLINGNSRFLIDVNFSENEIHFLINSKHYNNIFDELINVINN